MTAMLLPVAFASLLSSSLASHVSAPADEVALLQGKLSQTPVDATPEARLKVAIEMQQGRQGKQSGPTRDITQPMINFGDAQYVSYMQMGKQMIAGIVDTGSFELVVFGSDCVSCSVAAHYSHHLSDTYEPGTISTVHNYGSGGALCDEAMETVSMGPYPPVRQMFWEVVDAQMPVLQNAAFEAIIGVGPTEAALLEIYNEVDVTIKNLTNYYDKSMVAPADAVQTAQQMVKIALKLGKELPMLHSWGIQQFSICMGSGKGSDGVIVWNDTRPVTQKELFVTVPVLGDTHTWAAHMTAPALVDSTKNRVALSGCENGCQALIDSGTSLLAAPRAVVDGIIDAMSELNADCSNLDVLPTLNFKLGPEDAAVEFSLPPSAYVAKLSGDVSEYVKDRLPMRRAGAKHATRQCELVMMDTDGFGEGAMWILGVPFFRKYYVNFNLGAYMDERSFFIAPHSEEECVPASESKLGMAVDRKTQGPREIEASRLHLPHPSRRSRKWMPKLSKRK